MEHRAVSDDAARALARWLGDLAEVLSQLAVAGVAYPDPELPDALSDLAETARGLGLGASLDVLSDLREALVNVATSAPETRAAATRRAWEASQRLCAWHRRWEVECDLMRVEVGLAQSAPASGLQADSQQSAPGLSGTVRLLGLTCDPHGRATWYGVWHLDAPSKFELLRLRDQLSELDADDPTRRPVLSHLLQDAVMLTPTLAGLLRLEGQPLVRGERGSGVRAFVPAFRTVPKRLGLAAGAALPAVARLDLGRFRTDPVAHQAGALCLSLALTPALTVTLDDALEAPLAASRRIRFNLTKYCLSEGRTHTVTAWVAVTAAHTLDLIAAVDGLDTVCHPQLSPRLWRLSARRFAATLRAHPCPEPVEALLARLALGVLDPSEFDRASSISEVEALRPRGLGAFARVSLARSLLGLDVDGAEVVHWAQCMASALLFPDTAMGFEALGLLIARDPEDLHSADLRRIDARSVFTLAALVLKCGVVDEARDALKAIKTLREAEPLDASSIDALCARTLLALLVDGTVSAPSPDDDDTPAVVASAETERFFMANLEGLRARAAGGVTPEPGELLALSETLAAVKGDAHARGIAALGFDTLGLAETCLGALVRWQLDAPDAPREAAEAVFVATSGGFLDWLFDEV